MIASKLITLYKDAPPIDNGAVVFHHGSILAAGPADKIIRKYPGHRVYRLENTVLMPGLVNIHTHLELPVLLDKIRAKAFPDWVLNLIKAKRKLNTQDYKVAAANNIQTIIHTGTTTVGEICTHGITPALLKQSGLRAIIYHEIIFMNQSSVVSRPSSFVLSSFVPRPSSLLKNGLSPHTPYTVSEHALRQIGEIAKKKHLRLCMHMAESKDETRLLRKKESGLEKLYRAAGWDLSQAPSTHSSFEYLNRLGLLNNGFLAVHAVQVTAKDIHLIKRSRTPIAHCPRSNKELGVGRMPLKKFLDAEITVGLGTDSLASSPSLSMWDEMRYAYQMHKRDGVTAQDIFRIATVGGAKALGLDKEIGTLEPGKKADIIAVPLPEKNTGDLYSDLLSETKSCIMSIVDGKILYKENVR